MIEKVERNQAKEVSNDDHRQRQGHLSFNDSQAGRQNNSNSVAFLDHLDALLLRQLLRYFFLGIRGGRGWSSALDPQRNGHDREISGNEHGAGKVGADTDESVHMHQQIEEEALMEMLEQVVQAAEDALDGSAHGHLVLPALADGLQRDCVDMVRDEAAVRTRGVPEALTEHASEHRAQTVSIAVVVFPHLLDRDADTHLAAGDRGGGIHEVQIRELSVDAVVHDVDRVEALRGGVVEHDHALQRTAFQRERADRRR